MLPTIQSCTKAPKYPQWQASPLSLSICSDLAIELAALRTVLLSRTECTVETSLPSRPGQSERTDQKVGLLTLY